MHHAYAITALPPRERFGYFQAVVDRVFCPMHVEPAGVFDGFAGCIEAADLGALKLARVTTSPCTVRRRREDIARLTEAPYLIKFQLRGEALWSQRNRDVHLRPGDFVICSTAEPYTLRFRDTYEMPVLAVSDATMRALTPDPDRFLGVRMAGEDADCGLLSSFVAQVVARMSRLQEPMIHRVEANILDLLGGVLAARTAVPTLAAPVQLGRIKSYIAEHLRDRRLGPASIARAFGISTRQVHALFEGEPLTVGRYVRAQRVHECRRALANQTLADRSLTEIALNWGFYDLSHMSRCFRDEFGVTPRDYRTAAFQS